MIESIIIFLAGIFSGFFLAVLSIGCMCILERKKALEETYKQGMDMYH